MTIASSNTAAPVPAAAGAPGWVRRSLDRRPGSYALLFPCRQDHTVQVSTFGQVTLPRGHYVYAGSAFGSGGVAARVGRHARPDVKKKWHVDYLKARLECPWAQALRDLPGVSEPLRGLGATDCVAECGSHFFRLARRPDLDEVRRWLAGRSGAEALFWRP